MGMAGTELPETAVEISTNFKMLFSKYSKCHNLMNSTNYFNDEKISELGIYIHLYLRILSVQNCDIFIVILSCFLVTGKLLIVTLEQSIEGLMFFIRSTFPDASITPKLHMLEDHVV